MLILSIQTRIGVVLHKEVPPHQPVIVRLIEQAAYGFVQVMALVVACFQEEDRGAGFGEVGS